MGESLNHGTKDFIGKAFVWDAHSGFESRPDARLEKLEKWQKAGVSYLSVNVGYDVRPWKNTIDTLASFRRQIDSLKDRYMLVQTVRDIDRAKEQHRLSITFDIEGMESLDGNVDMVSLYYDLGVRQMLFAYNLNNRAGGGCHDQDAGLTEFGRDVVRQMNNVGMVVDCSHTGYRTTMDAMELSSDPVIFSHSNPRALVDHGRNIVDEQIKGCAATGGVIGINGIGMFLGGTISPNIFVDHIAYVSDLVGAEHVGLGLDYADEEQQGEIGELFEKNFDYWPPEDYKGSIVGFMSPEQLPRVTDLLFSRGFSELEIYGILGENFRRVADKVWK